MTNTEKQTHRFRRILVLVHIVPCVCHVAELNTNLNKQTMKRIKLTHGSARVSENITDETKEALNKMTELAYKHQTEQCTIQNVVLSVFESYTNAELEEEKRSLEAEIEAANDRLRSVENEMFWRKNPECRQH